MVMTWIRGLAGATEAGGSRQQPLGGGETLKGGEGEGKVLSHSGEVEKNQVMSQDEEAESGEEEGMGTQWTDGLSEAPGLPKGGLPSSASLAWGEELEVQRNL